MPKKRLYIIYTGGTIGMQHTKQGYSPTPHFLQPLLASMPELQHPEMPDFTFNEYTPLLDSANFTPIHWQTIANDIHANYADYDGFIVLHGTDTMAYTASALSFLLQDIAKPVILTGSQTPLIETRNDARNNLISSMLLASHYPLQEVSLYFNDRLFRGNRARKLNTHSYAAFDSPNFPALAQVGTDIITKQRTWLKPSSGSALQLHTLQNPNIISVRLFPGLAYTWLKQVLKPPLQGLILETYGLGNAPDDPCLFELLATANAKGIIVVNSTQCLHGCVAMEQYATGQKLRNAGVISAFDMTPEAALVKLYYLLSQELTLEDVKQQMQTNLRGELTPCD